MVSAPKKIAIIGGGAAGFFAALRCGAVAREKGRPVEISIFESSSQFLRKVKISGGGRCNVTHNQFDPRELCQNYPRGQRELLSPFHQFQAESTVDWFRKRGVELKAEADGRMFPITDSSSTIIDCFMREAEKLAIRLCPKSSVKALKRLEDGKLSLHINQDETFLADALLIATGSMPGGYRLAKSVGHAVTDLAPSLFTFKIQDPLLEGLSGTSFESTKLQLKVGKAKPFLQDGPLLITHWGLSGPALLKLSAWAAREMMAEGYSAELKVNWLGFAKIGEVEQTLAKIRNDHPKMQIGNTVPEGLTKRFWQQFLEVNQITTDRRWAELPKKQWRRMVDQLFSTSLKVSGKSRFKEEFVECGGIDLKEIHFKTMESKVCPGLHFAGEVMDVDGITGGFNFQNAWTSGWIAGSHMAGS